MAKFTVNTHRYDPYKSFAFTVSWDGRPVAGVSKVSPLKRTTEVVAHRDGAEPTHEHKSPGRTKYDAVTLERGVTHDPEFERWANLVHSVDDPIKLKSFRKLITLDMYNEAGTKVMAYVLQRCWVSEYTPLGPFDANSSAIAIESMKLEVETWYRDVVVRETAET